MARYPGRPETPIPGPPIVPVAEVSDVPDDGTLTRSDPLSGLIEKLKTDNLQAAIQIPVTPEYQKQFQRELFDRLRALADPEKGIPFVTPASAPFVAGLSPEQQQAITTAQAGLGSYLPFMQQAGATFDQAGGALGALGDYSDTLARMGGTAAGQATPFSDQAVRSASDARGTIGDIGQQVAGLQESTGRFDPSDISAFRNPFEDQLVEQIREDIAESTGRQRQRQEQALAASGEAAMGRRAERQRGDLAQKALEAEIDAITRLRKQGFDDAQTRAQQAFEAQQTRRQQAAQLGIAGLEGAGRLGLSAGELGLSAGELGLRGTELGGTLVGAGAGLLSDQAKQLQALGGLRADLGGAQHQAGLQDINTLLSLGGLTQQNQQALLDAQFRDAVAQQTDPYKALQIQSDIFAGIPSSQSIVTAEQAPPVQSIPQPSPVSQVAGLGLAGLGAYRSIFG